MLERYQERTIRAVEMVGDRTAGGAVVWKSRM